MIVDTSAWIEYSLNPDGPLGDAVDRALDEGQAMTIDVVRLELLIGLSVPARRAMNGILASCRHLPQEHIFDVDDALAVYERCRRAGETIRASNDCLIAAIAMRNDVPVLHKDNDFDVIARHTPLQAIRE
jgi:predicted nucleic acid-binding protein